MSTCFGSNMRKGVEFSEVKRLVEKTEGELPGSPVVRTPCSHCRGHGFHPWSGN